MAKYIPIEERHLPDGLRFDTPRHLQGQTVEYSYADERPQREPASAGSMYRRTHDRSDNTTSYAVLLRYTVRAPETPGAAPTYVCNWKDTLGEAQRFAARFSRGRRDLCGQDVRIEDSAGNRVQYAGPAR